MIVESEPAISDLIGRQALQSVGYQVQVSTDASSAIAKALQWSPDVILADLNLPGLTGKDLMVALTSQGIQTPVIIIAQRGAEADIIQTFRLGASDYLLLPAREAEVVNAVQRVLQQVHDRRERDRLAQQLQQANQELQSRVRELTTIFALGKAMTSITEQAVLFDKILEGAIRITQADVGWFLLRDDTGRKTEKPFVVVAEYHLPPGLGVRLYHPWDDGISSLVAMSGEVLEIHGEALKRFKIAGLGQSALIAPIKAQKNVVGILVMMRRAASAFGTSEQHLLEALADYASISLVNARLFRTVEERARALKSAADAAQVGEKVNNEILRLVKEELFGPSQAALAAIEQLVKDSTIRWRPDQRQAVTTVQAHLLHFHQISEAISPLSLSKAAGERGLSNLTDALHAAIQRVRPYAQRAGVTLTVEIRPEPIPVLAEDRLLAQALDGVLSNAVKFSGAGSTVLLRMEKTADQSAHILVQNHGQALDAKALEQALQTDAPPPSRAATPAADTRFAGLGIRLSLVKEIITRFHGKIWLETPSRNDAIFHIQFPIVRRST